MTVSRSTRTLLAGMVLIVCAAGAWALVPRGVGQARCGIPAVDALKSTKTPTQAGRSLRAREVEAVLGIVDPVAFRDLRCARAGRHTSTQAGIAAALAFVALAGVVLALGAPRPNEPGGQEPAAAR